MFKVAIIVSILAHLVFLLLFSQTSPSVSTVNSAAPVEPTPSSASTPSNEASFEKHADQLSAKLKDRGFTILIEKPFIVIGDEPETVIKHRTQDTVKWVVEKLKQDYFTKDPQNILEIWLFKDDVSYRKHAEEFFNDEPDTPYGYYSPANKALIMNIATGGGTLVHEIVHPFMEANFPDCPAWFNEGLGSLYEQSGEIDGHIHGFTNWRLPGLQKGIKKKIVPTFKTLTSKSDAEFYSDDTGVYYAQARYLCYYLQQKKLLTKYYKDFLANHKTDPTGYKTLRKTIGERDMNAFQRKWEAFVLKLTVGFEVDVN
ncbi:MAG TPA: hypothetical protein VGQ55_12830 [Pyrinomonadaceae bacterium]|jgi:hypothetical protein|nr:hypothetical protein [Pyrinomonadaceae bacterium]